jgi:hypothetical protein
MKLHTFEFGKRVPTCEIYLMKSSSIFTALLTENYSYMQMTLLLSQRVLLAFWQDSVLSEDERIDLMVDVPSLKTLNYWKL